MDPIVVKAASLGLNYAKTLNYTAQSILLPLINQLSEKKSERHFKDFSEHLKMAWPKVQKLLQKDAEHIARKDYPLSVVFQESPVQHYSRLPWLIADAIRANKQRSSKETALFDKEDIDYANQMPEYYKRNFHFQKGGYLNDQSADLYEHQVEILFSGTAQVMRRQMIPLLKNHFNSSTGEGLKFLEIGSGTGALTRSVALAFPKAQLTCVDASPHYLRHAQKRLSEFKGVNYIQGFGEDLNFKDQTFDAVFSCYLFHELPEKIRKSVLLEKIRVLKPNGFLGVMDSIQKNDDPDLNWALKQFPIDFHEPFYKNYTENKIEDLMMSCLPSEIKADIKTEINFLTKTVYGVKNVN